MQAIHTAALGMKTQQTRIDNIANNIANINTAGFKSSTVNFKDALYTLIDNPDGTDSEASNLLRGSGVLTASIATDFSDGTINFTGQVLDFAIRCDGFFMISGADGERYYTRNGSFAVSHEGQNNYLVTNDGYYVLNRNGERINLPGDISSVSATEDGVLYSGDGWSSSLGIVSFTNPDGLMSAGGSRYQATEVSGEATALRDFSVIQGALENSNVDLIKELTLLLRTQRAYSFASSALRTADSMEELANNIH
ncbi:MAG: flagellar hook-basal body protein [Eubacteriales bacterium]|nr:flagellar hook-basal body protein [Clostridiales bacterium]